MAAAASVASSPIRSAGTAGSPGFRSQRKLSAETIVKKIQTLEDAIESLRQQLVFTRSEEESIPQKEVKKPKEAKQPKEPKQQKEKMPAAAKQKKIQESKEEEKIPMPWTGQVDFTTCVGLKAQYGLFIQCGKACDVSSASFQIDNRECRFCSDCSKKCDENGKHSVGTIEERIEAGVGKYVNVKTGKRETIYIEVLEKMKITKEQALESAQRRGFQIPDWMLEKAEKKRGRPAATVAAAIVDPTALAINTGNDETKTKEKKPRQPHAKATTKATTTKATTTKATTTKATTTKAATTKKTAKASVATQDTPQKKNSAQSSICIDLNNDDESVTPVADADVADAASIAVASVASVASSIPQENEKKKRGRPTKSNTQSNVGESEMQQLIAQATTEKKKRLSLDAALDTHTSEEGDQTQVETHLTFEENGNEEEQLGEDEIFEMFDKMLENEDEDENEDEKNQQEQQEKQQQEQVVTVATKEKKGKSEKKAKKSDDKEKVEKISKKEAALKKAEEEAALKKAQEEAAFKKKAEAEDGEETEDEEDGSNEEEEELECEEYEYDGETYGLAPNGDIYSQDGDLVGKLTNGVPKMFN
jgi:hypothetical protein